MNFNYILNKKNTVKATLEANLYIQKSKNILTLIVNLVTFALALIMGIKTGEKLLFLLCVLCILRVATLFYIPYSNAKISAAAFENDKEFSFELIEGGAAIKAKEGERKEILFKNADKAFETKGFFIIATKERFYPIPKEFMENEQISELSEAFSKTFSNKK